jgi:hypothetical protein
VHRENGDNSASIAYSKVARPKRGDLQQQKSLYLLGNYSVPPLSVIPPMCTTTKEFVTEHAPDLSNSFISCMGGHGVPESASKLLVGHARESMTYGHSSNGERLNLREAINKLDYGAQIMQAICTIPSTSQASR